MLPFMPRRRSFVFYISICSDVFCSNNIYKYHTPLNVTACNTNSRIITSTEALSFFIRSTNVWVLFTTNGVLFLYKKYVLSLYWDWLLLNKTKKVLFTVSIKVRCLIYCSEIDNFLCRNSFYYKKTTKIHTENWHENIYKLICDRTRIMPAKHTLESLRREFNRARL